MQNRFVITAVKPDGMRHLATNNNHLNTYATYQEAQTQLNNMIENNSPETLAELCGRKLTVVLAPCYDTGDCSRTVFGYDCEPNVQVFGLNDEGAIMDAIEVHPCTICSYEEDGKAVVAVVDSEHDEDTALFWSVYVHWAEGGIECIADAPTREGAEALADLLRTIGNTFYRNPEDEEI